MTDLKNNERCVLCLDEKRFPVRVQCGHSFCNECLAVYKSYHKYAWANKCPICRDPLKNKNGMSQSRRGRSSIVSTETSSATTSAVEQCILEQFIAIATDEYGEEDPTTSAGEFEEDDVEMSDNDEDENDVANYFTDSDEDMYEQFENDEYSLDHIASIVDLEDYEAQVVANSEVTILTSDSENLSNAGSDQSIDSEVVFVDDFIVIVD